MATDPYGYDVSTFPDLDVTGVQVSGPRAVMECLLRRLTNGNGSIKYDADAGYDLRNLLNEDLSDSDLRRHESLAAIECEKDERVRTAEVQLTLTRQTHTLRVRISGDLKDLTPFNLTAAITSISAEILSTST